MYSTFYPRSRSLVMQIIFSAISIGVTRYSLSSIPWFVYFVAFVWPLVFLPWQEFVKRYDKKEYLRFQKRSRLEFSTKLGGCRCEARRDPLVRSN